MWLPCDCAEKLQQTSAANVLERVWGGQGTSQAGCDCYGGHWGSSAYGGQADCSCYGSHGGSSAFGGPEGSSGYGGHEGSSAFGGPGGSSGFGGHRGSTGAGGHWESSGIEGSSGYKSKGGVKGHRRSDRVGGRGGTSDIGDAEANDGDEGIGDSDSGSDIGGEGGDRDSGIEGKKGEHKGEAKRQGGIAAAGKSGYLHNIHSLWTKLYDYWGPVGLWNLAMVTLLLGYYGKKYYWDTSRWGGYSTGRGAAHQLGGKTVGGAPHQLGGKRSKCPLKAETITRNKSSCCESCSCRPNRPRILKERLKWPEEPC